MALRQRCVWAWVSVLVAGLVLASPAREAVGAPPAAPATPAPFADSFPAGGLLYVGWTGADNLPPAVAASRLNKLLSEPELQRFGEVGVQLLLRLATESARPPVRFDENGNAAPAAEPPQLDAQTVATIRKLGVLLTRSAWGLQVHKAGGSSEQIVAEAALIVDDPKGSVAETVAPLLAKLPTGVPGGEFGNATIAGRELRTWTPKPPVGEKLTLPVLHWGRVAGKFVIALEAGYAAKIVAALQAGKTAPEGHKPLSGDAEFALVTGRLAAPNAALTVYVDGARLRETIGDIAAGVAGAAVPAGPASSAAAATARTATSGVLARLGLTELAGAGLAIDFRDADTRHVAFMHTIGKRSGVLALLGGDPAKSITPESLTAIPADANGFFVFDCDWRAAYELLIGTMALIPGSPGADIEAGLEKFKDRSGVDVVRQIIGSLGSKTTLLNVPRIGGDGFFAPVLLVEIRKPQTLRRAEEGLADYLNKEVFKQKPDDDDDAPWRWRGRQEVTTSTVAGRTMRCCELGRFNPWAPSWALTEQYLVVGLHAQPVAAMVRHLESQSGPTPAANITANPAFAEVRKRLPAGDGVAALSWGDAPNNYPTVSTLLYLFANLLASERMSGQPTGELFDPMDVPATDIVVKHLAPTLEQLRVTPDGLLLDTRGTLAGLLDSPMLMGPLPGTMMPMFFVMMRF